HRRPHRIDKRLIPYLNQRSDSGRPASSRNLFNRRGLQASLLSCLSIALAAYCLNFYALSHRGRLTAESSARILSESVVGESERKEGDDSEIPPRVFLHLYDHLYASVSK